MLKNLIPGMKADILIIDDTPDNLRLLNKVLSQHYKVRLAPSGSAGLKAAHSTPPDLILLDVMMPGTNGYQVAAQLKADEQTAEIPIIFISALDDTESKIRGFEAGGVDYITKPFQEQEVLARVNTHLSLRALYLQAQKEIAERKRAEENLRKQEKEYKTLVENTPDVIARFDRQYRHIYVNPIVEKEFGMPPAKLLGKTHRELIHSAEPADQSEQIIRQVFETGKEVVFESSIPTPTGNKYYLSRGVPEFAEDGSVISTLIIHRNITERKLAEEHVRQLSRAVESSPTSIVITDLKGDIQYVNPKFTEVTGYPPSEVIGKNPRILKSGQTPPEVHAELWKTIPSGKEWHGEFCNRKKNGDLYWESVSISPITDGNGAITHYVAVKEDITERKRVDAALKRSEAFSRSIIENEPECVKIIGAEGILKYMNPAGLAMIEVEDLAMVAGRSVYPIVVPEHREAFIDLTEKVLRGERGILQFEIIGLKGTRRWLETHGAPLFDAQGNVEALLGVTRDITERKQAEEREREQRAIAESLRNTAEALNSSLQLDDILDKILDNVERVVPYDAMTVAWLEGDQISILRRRGYGSEQDKLADKQSFAMDQIPTFAQTIETRQPLIIPDVKSSAIWVTSPQTEWVRSHIKAPIVIDSKVIGIINLHSKTPGFYNAAHARNLQTFANQVAIAARNAQLYEEIQHIAIYDPLTGLYNRRYMEEALTREYARAARRKEPLSIVMMDMDGLKKFNDTYGHDLGDQAIKTFASQLKLMTRAEDIACRYGGDEFLVILYNTDMENASKRVEEWQRKMDETGVSYQGETLHIAFSAGIATYPTDGDGIHEVVKAADDALYQKKRTGFYR
jgi:diguanylate cyclase (GGDEF)-like protein/PAS domain S-box-containing protein